MRILPEEIQNHHTCPLLSQRLKEIKIKTHIAYREYARQVVTIQRGRKGKNNRFKPLERE